MAIDPPKLAMHHTNFPRVGSKDQESAEEELLKPLYIMYDKDFCLIH